MSSESSVTAIEQIMKRTGHSRIPVFSGDLDNISGFVHVKDLMRVDDDERDSVIDPGLVRSPLFVPESAHIRAVLDDMRRTRIHFAIVVDEHGSTAGSSRWKTSPRSSSGRYETNTIAGSAR
jgi:magnesium and cobalt transporter